MTTEEHLRLIVLPYTKPPLTANQRLHWAQKARLTKQIRRDTYLLARSAGLNTSDRITVRLEYYPRDRRRRDPSNLMPTQKAAVDGIVDAGLVPDDCPPYVTEHMPIIEQQKEPLNRFGHRLQIRLTWHTPLD